jgi:hypothetical protein
MRSDGVPQRGQSAVAEVETRRATAVVGVRTISSRRRSAIGRRSAITQEPPISEWREEKGKTYSIVLGSYTKSAGEPISIVVQH